jgi:hypothetical protein
VVPSVNVLSAAIAVIMFIEMLELDPITSITGNVRVVKLPIVAGAMLPRVNTARARSTPTLVRAGRFIVTSAAIVLGKNAPFINDNTGKEKVVSEAIVLGLKVLLTNVNAGADNVGKRFITVGEKPPPDKLPTDAKLGIDRVVRAASVVGTKPAPTVTSDGADRVTSDAFVPGLKLLITTVNAGIDSVVSNGKEVGLKLTPVKLKTGKLSEVKRFHVVMVNVLRIPAKFAKVSVADGPLAGKTSVSIVTPSGTVNVAPACAPDFAETIAINGAGAVPVYATETANIFDS